MQPRAIFKLIFLSTMRTLSLFELVGHVTDSFSNFDQNDIRHDRNHHKHVSLDGEDIATLDVESEVSKPEGIFSYSEGGGMYHYDYERLLKLAPRSGQAETLAGEMMRAVEKLNRNSSSHDTLNTPLDALNLLALVGLFDEKNIVALATIYPYAKQTNAPGDTFEHDEVKWAIEKIIDCVIEFILMYPDLEYFENTTDMSILCNSCQLNYIERELSKHATTVNAWQEQILLSANVNESSLLMEISTPRIANKTSTDIIEMAKSEGKTESSN